MGGEPALERSVLERKERDELHTIAEALGVKPGSRTRKADLIDQILHAAGVDIGSDNGAVNGQKDAPARTKATRDTTGTETAEAQATDTPPADTPATEVPATELPTSGRPAGDAPTSDPRGDTSDAQPDPAGAEAAADAPGEAEAAAETDAAGKAASSDGAGTDEPIGDEKGEDAAEAKEPTGRGRRGGGGSSDREQGRGHQQRSRGGQQQSGQQGSGQQGSGQQQSGQQGSGQQGSGQQGHDGAGETGNRRGRRRRGRDRDRDRDLQAQERGAEQQYQGEPIPVAGLLDLPDQGYGFIRTAGYLAGNDDIYVSMSQVKKFALRRGDYIEGASRPALGNEKYGALLRIDTVSGMSADEARARPRFEDLTPLFPDDKLKMELPGDAANITARIIDLISPIGKGQRGMIVSPPKAGKTTVIKHMVKSIEANNPEVHLMVLLVDERPEEVTDMRRSTKGEVISSTFDRPSDEHTQVAELALDRAKRLVEQQKDVVIIMDGITRLARAYNLSAPASGRLTSGGIDQAAIYPPKRFFGAARNIEEGGSLTILATALIETGSKADDVIFEEFKGTGNMELRLDRKLAERRLYPAIDVNASSTRHEELLFDRRSLELVWRLRRVLNGLAEDGTSARALDLLIEKIKVTKSNTEFLHEIAKAQGAL